MHIGTYYRANAITTFQINHQIALKFKSTPMILDEIIIFVLSYRTYIITHANLITVLFIYKNQFKSMIRF